MQKFKINVIWSWAGPTGKEDTNRLNTHRFEVRPKLNGYMPYRCRNGQYTLPWSLWARLTGKGDTNRLKMHRDSSFEVQSSSRVSSGTCQTSVEMVSTLSWLYWARPTENGEQDQQGKRYVCPKIHRTLSFQIEIRPRFRHVHATHAQKCSVLSFGARPKENQDTTQNTEVEWCGSCDHDQRGRSLHWRVLNLKLAGTRRDERMDAWGARECKRNWCSVCISKPAGAYLSVSESRYRQIQSALSCQYLRQILTR